MKSKQSDSAYGMFVDGENRTLLVKDSSSLVWGFPGGSVELTETHAEAVRREVFEETGLRVEVAMEPLVQWLSPTKDRYVYKIISIDGVVLQNGNGKDTLAARFFRIDEVLCLELAYGVRDVIFSEIER